MGIGAWTGQAQAGVPGVRRGGQGLGKHMGWGVDGVLGPWPEQPDCVPSMVEEALTLGQERGQRGSPRSFLFLRGFGYLGRAPGNMLFFPVHDVFLFRASVSPPQIVTSGWDISQAPSMPVLGPQAWHFVGSEPG